MQTIIQEQPMHAASRGAGIRADAPAPAAAPAALLGVDRAHVSPLWYLLVLIFLACLPDAMLPPVLQGLLVQRYGITPTAAHWFMTVNLIGALAAVPVLMAVRRRLPPALVLAAGAAANAALLLALAAPIGFGWSVAVRFAEGIADMVVLAVLFDLLSRGGPRAWRGHRLGLGGTALMLGLAVGAVAGGRLGRDAPLAVLPAGAAACGLLGTMAVLGWRLLRRSDDAQAPVPETEQRANGLAPLWPSLAMFGADRALAGLLSTTVPLLLASVAGWDSLSIGLMIGVPMGIMALGSWPAGVLADRFGNLKVRTIAALFYAVAVAAIPLLGPGPQWLLLTVMLALGVAASALMPTALTFAARTERGSVAMGACHAAGNVGYLVGIAGAGGLLGLLGGPQPKIIDYTMTIQIFALLHVAITGITLARLAR